jgi:hypothetical protein
LIGGDLQFFFILVFRFFFCEFFSFFCGLFFRVGQDDQGTKLESTEKLEIQRKEKPRRKKRRKNQNQNKRL